MEALILKIIKKRILENNLDIGDIGLFYSTLHHGVDKVSINKK